MPKMCLTISTELDKLLDRLIVESNSKDKWEVILRAIALLDILVKTQQKGGKMMLTDKDSNPITEVTH